jgi:hypothetical protein
MNKKLIVENNKILYLNTDGTFRLQNTVATFDEPDYDKTGTYKKIKLTETKYIIIPTFLKQYEDGGNLVDYTKPLDVQFTIDEDNKNITVDKWNLGDVSYVTEPQTFKFVFAHDLA